MTADVGEEADALEAGRAAHVVFMADETNAADGRDPRTIHTDPKEHTP